MGSRFVRPEVITLKLADGETLTVRRRLTAGEQRQHYARIYSVGPDGKLRTNPFQTGRSLMMAYLLDWSLADDNGSKVQIGNASADEVGTVLDSLSIDAFNEIRQAIENHEEAMNGERDAQKKTTTGVTPSEATSPSRVDSAGAMSGSAT